ncbi:MAG TPA: hypothetical protein VK146_03205, partial [Tabrizicola sp.]|nr:hypothetical protein [Tabrizicola sp.]
PATDDFLPFDDDWSRIALRSHPTSPNPYTRDQHSLRRLYTALTGGLLANIHSLATVEQLA